MHPPGMQPLLHESDFQKLKMYLSFIHMSTVISIVWIRTIKKGLTSLTCNGIGLKLCSVRATDLEESAVDHSGHQQYLLLRRSSSAPLESWGWDVNPVIRQSRFSLKNIITHKQTPKSINSCLTTHQAKHVFNLTSN